MNTAGSFARSSKDCAALAITLFCVLAPVAEPAEGPAPKFATGVNDPGAQWMRDAEPYAGSGLSGYLDGPRREMMCRNAPSIGWWFEPGGDFTIRKYNRLNERFYTIAGRARGYLDGPLSRARFGGIGYMHDHDVATSPDGRFVYFTEPDMGGLLRRIDFQKGEVSTLSKDLRFGGMTADSQGRLYGLNRDSLSILDSDGKLIETRKLDFTGAGNVNRLFGAFMNIALDEVHNRLYAANRAPGDLTKNENLLGVADIVACRVDASGKPLDAEPFVVSGAKDMQEKPRAAFAPSTDSGRGGGVFLVVWQDLRNEKDYDIRFESMTILSHT